MIPTPKLAEIVLSRNAETEATQEKLVALVTRHHEELGQLLEVLPELKREALDNINARLENVIADATGRTAAIARGQQAEFAATAEFKMGEKMRVIEPLLASLQATRDEIHAQLAGLGQKHTESLAEITGSLTDIAEERARAMLASDETKGLIRAALDEHSKPILAALESKGGSFIDLYQGDFLEGRSKAQRGQIWSYFGNTLLCVADTVRAPSYLLEIDPSWKLLAARGANGQPGSGGSGSSLPDQAGNNGKFLTTDGSTPSWATLAGGGDLLAANNLSDVASAAAAFNNIKQAATTAATGVVELATSAETTAGLAVQASDTRLSDARTPTTHAATHVNGTDDIQNATAAQKGLATAAQITKLDGIEAGADVTDATNVSAAGALMKSALGTGVETALAANIGAAGAPVTFNGALGTPSSGNVANCTGLPIANITGLGTGVATALAINTGSAGAPVLLNGALGTPSSGTLTNCTFPTLNQNTTGTAAGLSAILNIATGGTGANTVLLAQQNFNPLTINANTTTAYTLALTDVGKLVTMSNANASVLTVPNNNTVAFPTGISILGTQLGAGQVTISASDNTVTVSSRGSALKSAGQYAVWSLLKQDTNVWILSGDLAT